MKSNDDASVTSTTAATGAPKPTSDSDPDPVEEELTNISTCSSSNLSFTEASTRDNADNYADVGFMFDGLQQSTLKRFTWSRIPAGDTCTKEQPAGASSEPLTSQQQVISVAIHLVDDEPGALQSGHYLWPASPALAEFMIQMVSSSSSSSSSQESSPTNEKRQRLSSLYKPHNSLELGAGCALLSLTALQLWHDSLQCIVVSDHDPGTLERARDSYETTMEDLLEQTQSEEEQMDCINGIASIPVLFECLEWGDETRAQRLAWAAGEHSSPLLLEDTTTHAISKIDTTTSVTCSDATVVEGTQQQQQQQQCYGNPNHDPERNIFDLVLGSDLIYCRDVVEPLFRTVSYFMRPGGTFLYAQSLAYDDETEQCIDQTCQNLNLNRTLLSDTINTAESNTTKSGGVRIEQFTWKTGNQTATEEHCDSE